MTRFRPKIVIVGAGLGGCLAAHRLADFADVTLVEQGPSDGLEVVDHDVPLGIRPYAGTGPGGSTRLWDNGLIEAPRRAFRDWPFGADVLDPWLEEAHVLLGGVGREAVRPDAESLREFALGAGIPPQFLTHRPLYWPGRRDNLWEILGLARRVRLVRGYVDELNLDPDGRLTSVGARTLDGHVRLDADVAILAAGGLGTPGFLQLLAGQGEKPIAGQAGRYYDDHPSGFVGEFSAPAELGRLWNCDTPATGGTVSLPLVVETPECYAAFYVRPAVERRRTRYGQVKDRMVDPSRSISYARILGGRGRPPTRFNLFLLAGIPPSASSRVWREDPLGPTHRNWHIDGKPLEELREAMSSVLEGLQGIIHDVHIYEGWNRRLMSGAHHSGTARLASDPTVGVCNADARVFEVPNLYVSDGALIPQSGFANTGLTIGALALRLGDHLKETLR